MKDKFNVGDLIMINEGAIDRSDTSRFGIIIKRFKSDYTMVTYINTSPSNLFDNEMTLCQPFYKCYHES